MTVVLPCICPGCILHQCPLPKYGFVPGFVVVGETHPFGSSSCRGLPGTIRSGPEARFLVLVLKPGWGQLLERGYVH